MIYGATNNPLRPVTEEIKSLASLGFDYLELCLDPPNGLPETLQNGLSEVRSILAGEKISIPVVHMPTFVWLADIYPSIREASVSEMFKALDLAAEIGAKKAVLHPGYLTGLMSFMKDTGKKYASESLDKILERANGFGITVCLENMFQQAGHMYRPEEFAEILQQKPKLMITLDLGHANIKAPKNQVEAFVKVARGRIGHVHVCDNNGQADDHLPVGAGRVDIAGGLSVIKDSGYDSTITLEVFSPDRDYLSISLKKIRTIWDRI